MCNPEHPDPFLTSGSFSPPYSLPLSHISFFSFSFKGKRIQGKCTRENVTGPAGKFLKLHRDRPEMGLGQ